ncbi:MAG: TIGR00159 family protein [Clostridia bacterium]|nr:TIGR00159 family protein [Clostridia bacterium]
MTPLAELWQDGIAAVLLSLVDIAVVACVLYLTLVLIRGTRALHLVNGILVLFLIYGLSRWLRLETTRWLLDKAVVALAVALPIVFQPELRRALERVGSGSLLRRTLPGGDASDAAAVIAEVVRAALVLARKKIGAIVVLERETRLNDVVETGIFIDGLVSAEFLVNIFTPNTPLHDGAVLVRGNRVVAAACFLPLTEQTDLSVELGSRHRAALGISERSDAVSLVVSEETGVISIADGGKLIRHLDEETLRETLETMLSGRRARSTRAEVRT